MIIRQEDRPARGQGVFASGENPGSDQKIGTVFGMKDGMYHLSDHQRGAKSPSALFDGGAAFGWREAIAAALQGHRQKTAVLEFAKHSRGLLAAHLSQVSQRSVNILRIVSIFMWQNNGEATHA